RFKATWEERPKAMRIPDSTSDVEAPRGPSPGPPRHTAAGAAPSCHSAATCAAVIFTLKLASHSTSGTPGEAAQGSKATDVVCTGPPQGAGASYRAAGPRSIAAPGEQPAREQRRGGVAAGGQAPAARREQGVRRQPGPGGGQRRKEQGPG